MRLKIITTGGTIDKIYFDQASEFQVGDPQVQEVLREANVSFDYEIIPLLKKDSLDMQPEDRRLIRERIAAEPGSRFVVTHGTDTMVETALVLQDLPGKVIVLTGSMQPARFRMTDAVFNIGCAVTAAQTLPPGVYIAINGQVLDPNRVRKNREKNRFEEKNGA